jgi:hypothetical protein
MLHGAGIFTSIYPNKITQFCRKIYQHHGSHYGTYTNHIWWIFLWKSLGVSRWVFSRPSQASAAFGGMAPTTLRATKLEADV